MWKALFWKNWRECRWIILIGWALGILWPFLFISFCELRNRFFPGDPWRFTEALSVFSPLGALLFQSFWSLLAAVRVFSTDRASGTEASFLLNQPVPRWRTWMVQGVWAVIVSASFIAPACFATPTVFNILYKPLHFLDENEAFPISGIMAVLVVFSLFFVGVGALAARISRRVLNCLLLGGGLSWGSIFLITTESENFTNPTTLVFCFVGLCSLSLLAFALAFVLATFGEPQGRGWAKRAALAAACWLLTAAPASFGIGTWMSRTTEWIPPEPLAPSSSLNLVLHSDGNSWLIDRTTGERKAALGPGFLMVAWNNEGTKFAVATNAADIPELVNKTTRIRIFNSDGQPEGDPLDLGECLSSVEQMAWVGADAIALTAKAAAFRSIRLHIIQLSPVPLLHAFGFPDGNGLSIAGRLGSSKLALVTHSRNCQLREGSVFLDSDSPCQMKTFDLNRHSFDSQSLFEKHPNLSPLANGLSPSGQFWLLKRIDTGHYFLLNWATSQVQPLALDNWLPLLWMAGDQLLLHRFSSKEECLATTETGNGKRIDLLRCWPHSNLELLPSPDRQRLLVTATNRGGIVSDRTVVDLQYRKWTDLSRLPPKSEIRWSGAHELQVLHDKRLLLFELARLDDPVGIWPR